MTMPLSEQFCTFLVDGQLFGITVPNVQEVMPYQQTTRVPLAPQVVVGMINLRGKIVSAIDLRRRLGFAERQSGQLPMNVLVRTHEGTVSLLVDEIGDVIELETTAIESPPETLQGIAREVVKGVYKLPHRLLVILDVDRVIDLGESAEPGSQRQD